MTVRLRHVSFFHAIYEMVMREIFLHYPIFCLHDLTSVIYETQTVLGLNILLILEGEIGIVLNAGVFVQ